MAEERSYLKPMELFEAKELVTICAPMVRYSKLAFRSLVRQYGCDLCFTPMIISDSFIQSLRARHSDFTTSHADRPLIVQFAASNSEDWAKAAQLVAPYCDGVDLNCGCPQRWAMAEGYGACLIHRPQLLADMVRHVRRSLPSHFTVSVKIRLHTDVRRTVELARQIEAAGASFLSVHGRTQDQRGDIPVNLEAIADIKTALDIPVVANGDIRSMEDATRVKDATGVNGVMSAQGLLDNPAMFAGEPSTPLETVREWVCTSLALGTHYQTFHHHLIYMMDKSLSRAERRYFNGLGSTSGVLSYLSEKYMMEF